MDLEKTKEEHREKRGLREEDENNRKKKRKITNWIRGYRKGENEKIFIIDEGKIIKIQENLKLKSMAWCKIICY
jgi:hypothetical protein